jgi:hypothetical protein
MMIFACKKMKSTLDDEEEKGQGPSAIGADYTPSPLQQQKALCNKFGLESKQRRWIHQPCTQRCSARHLEHPRSFFGRFRQRAHSD